jgi:RNA recognition motif-containing protein
MQSTQDAVACTVYVGNIDNRMTESRVRSFFAQQFGPVNRIKMGGYFPSFSIFTEKKIFREEEKILRREENG